MVFVQKWPFFEYFWISNIGKENLFCDILERKNASLGYKNNKSKKSKNWHISKAVNPWFWSKNGLFSNFSFLGNISQENVFNDIRQRKNAFLGYKNKKSKKSGKLTFFKKTHGFGPKVAIFPAFFFRQYRPGKCLLWYSRTKKHLSTL